MNHNIFTAVPEGVPIPGSITCDEFARLKTPYKFFMPIQSHCFYAANGIFEGKFRVAGQLDVQRARLPVEFHVKELDQTSGTIVDESIVIGGLAVYLESRTPGIFVADNIFMYDVEGVPYMSRTPVDTLKQIYPAFYYTRPNASRQSA